jgi:hypothetical protein
MAGSWKRFVVTASTSHMNSGVHREICFPAFFIFYFRSCVSISSKKSYRELIIVATWSWGPTAKERGFKAFIYKPCTHFPTIYCHVYGETLRCADPPSVESYHEGFAFPTLFWIGRGQTIQSAEREDAYRHYKNRIELNDLLQAWYELHAIGSSFIFSQLSLVWKNESRLMRSLCCVSVNSSLWAFKCLNQSLWNSVCISWHLSQSQRLAPISLCVRICIPCVLARQKLGKL